MEGKFCNHCGQAADTHRLNMHFIWHEIQHGLIHVDHGIFYTISQLLTRPGHTIRDFINGKRVRHFKPVALVVILATIYGLLFHYFINDFSQAETVHPKDDVIDVYGKVTRWTIEHFAYSTLILIFNTTFVSYVVFKKQGYNFAEHLVLNTFYYGLVLVAGILLFPVLYMYLDTKNALFYANCAQIIDFILMYWCYSEFFSRLSKTASFGLSALTFFIIANLSVGIAYMLAWVTTFVS